MMSCRKSFILFASPVLAVVKRSKTLFPAIFFCDVTTILLASDVYLIYLTWYVWRDIDVSIDKIKKEKEILFWSLIFPSCRKINWH